MRKYIIITTFIITLLFCLKAYSQSACFFVDGQYVCLPSSFIQAGSINWDSLNQNIGNEDINWYDLNQDIGAEDINWDDLSQEIRVEDINWTSIPNYSDGKTLKARSLVTGGLNWE